MKSEDTWGNSRALETLQHLLQKKTLAPCYLLSGPEGVGIQEHALSFAKAFLSQHQQEKKTHSQHPDLHLFFPEGKAALHPIEKMRALKVEAYLNPLVSKKKVFFIKDVEKMLPSAANALLKVFEEPPEDTLFLLSSSAPQKILPTILSRCQSIPFEKIPAAKLLDFLQKAFKDPLQAQLVLHLSDGSKDKAKRLTQCSTFFELRGKLLEALQAPSIPYATLYSWQSLFEAALQERVTPCSKIPSDSSVYLQELHKKYDEAKHMQEIQETFEDICWVYLSFYRDLLLAEKTQSPKAFFNRDIEKFFLSTVSQEASLKLKQAQEKVQKALLGLQRHIKPFHCFEALFL